MCKCGEPKCKGVDDADYHQCGGPRESCGCAGCPECGCTRWRAFRWAVSDFVRRLFGWSRFDE